MQEHPIPSAVDVFTLQFVSRECSECRAHLIALYKDERALGLKGEEVIPPATIRQLMGLPYHRLAAREALTRLHRIAVGCERGVLLLEMVAAMEGSFIVNTTIRWAHFILDMRTRRGFATAYSQLFHLIAAIASTRKSTHSEADHWIAVEQWAGAPGNPELLASVTREKHIT